MLAPGAYAAPMGMNCTRALKWGLGAALLAMPCLSMAGLQLAPGHADAIAINRWLSAAAGQGGPRCTETRVAPPLPGPLQGRVVLTGWRCELHTQPNGEVRRLANVQVRLVDARYLQWPAQRIEWQEAFTLDSDSANPGNGLRVWVGATQARLLPAWQAGGAAERQPDGSWQRLSNGGGTLATLRCGPRGAAPCEIGDFLVP